MSNGRGGSDPHVRLAAVVVFLLAGFAGLVRAQKAEPVPIVFAPGSSHAAVRGALRGGQQMGYGLAIRTPQPIALRLLENPPGSLRISLRDSDNQEVPLSLSGEGRWKVIPPGSGDYTLWVIRVSEHPGLSRYRLTVSIQ